MILIFQRTTERQYAIEIEREGLQVLEMRPAPGYDPKVPHDMMHLVVEAVLGLDRAVFGQIAEGGNAGTFRIKEDDSAAGRRASRGRRAQKKKGDRLRSMEGGHFDISERATYVCWHEWLSRSASPNDRNKAKGMAEQAAEIRDRMEPTERRALESAMDRICRHLDQLSSEWSGLAVGGKMYVKWPDLTVLKPQSR